MGWLERGHVYNKGPVREEVVDTLLRLLVDPWQPVMNWGWHVCSLCPLSHFPPTLTYKGKRIAMGISNVFVPGDQCIYVAPSMIAHYMSVQEYAPPQAFCQALLACPPMHSTHYLQAILRVFGKVEVVHLDWEDGSCYNGKSEVEPNLLNSKGGCI